MSNNTEASQIQAKIRALSKVNAEIISNIENTVSSVPLGFLYQLNEPNGITRQFTVTEQHVNSSQIFSQIWKSKTTVELFDTEEMNLFNDNIKYTIASFEDLKRLNTLIPLVAAKFGWLDAEKSPPVLRLFLSNLEVVQVCLGQTQESTIGAHSHLSRLNSIVDKLNQVYQELVIEIQNANSSSGIPIGQKESSPEGQKQTMKELDAIANQRAYREGDTYYIVSCKWYNNWKNYVGYDSENVAQNNPGPIDNTNIIDTASPWHLALKQNAQEKDDFVILTSDCWNLLHGWYGSFCSGTQASRYGGGPTLPRVVIATGWITSTLHVEVRPLLLKASKSSDLSNTVYITISKGATVGQLKREACSKLGLKVGDVRVWDYYNSSKYKLLEEDMDQRLETAQVISGQAIFLEAK